MSSRNGIRVAVNGYGVIGKRVAEAVAKQNGMQLAGAAEIAADGRPRMAMSRGTPLFGATLEHADAMRKAGPELAGTLEDLLGQVDIVIDCTPKKVALRNVGVYRQHGPKFVVEGGERHSLTGHSFVAESNYASAVGRDAARVVSRNTVSIARTLSALKRSGLPGNARGTLNAVKKLVSDAGRPRADLYEIAVWEDMLKVQGNELFYGYMVDNQATVIPETVDAIRASIGKTDAALGIGGWHW